MTARRIPIFSTIVVVAAVLTMIGLGIWQYRKMGPQEARLAQHDAALADPNLVSFPTTSKDVDWFAYRRSRIECQDIVGQPRTVAGRNRQDQVGFVQVVTCKLPTGQIADVQLGWTQSVQPVDWGGGAVEGIIEPLRTGLAKLVADPPLAGLAANAPPEKHKIDHLAYAGQWFFFALTAMVIYVLALRRRQR
ncbi:MAG: SURF1 family protein [Porphyrobacter sp.]|nr:SURF1 family protein [Porphyrobacter sp.]